MGKDIHAEKAAELLGTPVEEVTPSQRTIGKIHNFPFLYNTGPESIKALTMGRLTLVERNIFEVSKSQWVIIIPYIGGVLSKNAYKFKTRGTKPEVKAWMESLAYKAREIEVPKYPQYLVKVKGYFWDNRRPDIHNLFPVIADALQEGLGVNDKNFRMVDEGFELGYETQVIRITIKGLK